MIASIHQPQYAPWLGYFDKMFRADVFILLDTVQFKKNEFQNRNRIKTAQGWQWITVPVRYRFPQLISEVTINNDVNWPHKHTQALFANYTKSPFFETLMPVFDDWLSKTWSSISDLNSCTVKVIAEQLGVQTEVRSTDGMTLSEDPTGRLIDICRAVGATTYLSGAGGSSYLDEQQFETADIELRYQRYEHPTYDQLYEGFLPCMSALDLLFNHGPSSLDILTGRGARP